MTAIVVKHSEESSLKPKPLMEKITNKLQDHYTLLFDFGNEKFASFASR